MSLTSIILKYAAPIPDIEQYERFLFIGPHPDDLEIGAGATAAKLCSAGKKVSFLICMDGRFGLDYAPKGTTPEQLVQIRKEETLDGAKELGVADVRFLCFSDGGLYDTADLQKQMARVIGEVKPDVIFAPDPRVDSECHPDHLNTGETAMRLSFFAPFKEIMASYGAEDSDVKAIAFYMTAKPNAYIKTSGFTESQFKALECHKSQFPLSSDALKQVKLYLKIRSRAFGVHKLSSHAEGFRILGKTQMHCLPEAGL